MRFKQAKNLDNKIWEHPLTILGLVGGMGLFVAGLWSIYIYRWLPFLRNALIASRDSCLTFFSLLKGYPLIALVLFIFVLLAAGFFRAVYRVSHKFHLDRRIESKQTLLKRGAVNDPKLRHVLDAIFDKTQITVPVYLVKSKKPVCLVQGLLRPSVIISTAICGELTEDELEAAMLHEISHLKAKDPLKRLAVEFVADWLFFIPMIRELSVHLGYLQEVLADSYAGKVSGKPATLASAIVKIATTDDLGLASPLGQTHLTKRVKRLLGVRHSVSWRLGVLSVIVSTVFIVMVVAIPFAIGSEKVISQNGNACAKQCLVSAGSGQASDCVKDCAKGLNKH
jgi:Zn-dependent protease with chaperone function